MAPDSHRLNSTTTMPPKTTDLKRYLEQDIRAHHRAGDVWRRMLCPLPARRLEES